MKYLGLRECRSRFLDYYESEGHTRLKSFSLVPEDDDSLLLINAGMAPLKAYFLGEKTMTNNRATSAQRCVRTADIENVGKTARHATFFEMLGNFSFGDYFKREAIHWSWTFLTEKMGLDKSRFWITVYEDDQDAYDVWTKEEGIPEDRMLRLGKEDNFWELEQGPCGPCSEIHYDRGPAFGEGESPLDNSDRFMEVWNLVFTQFNREEDGSYTPLAHPNIDTGMGLERLALVMEDKANIFELDEFQTIRETIHSLSGKSYGDSEKVDESFRVIIDHSKAVMFLVSDGVVPSNEGRGYVLRRLLRRAARHGRLLGIEGKFLSKTIHDLIGVYDDAYPELVEGEKRIDTVVEREEAAFAQTIDQGLALLETVIDRADADGTSQLDGEKVFRLYDTFGFPIDLTKEIAAERGKTVDEDDFRTRMNQQRAQSRANRKEASGWDTAQTLDLDGVPATTFLGYEALEAEARVVALFLEGARVAQLQAGDKGIVVLDRTPFYAESGGQVADHGALITNHGKADVIDVKKDKNMVFKHTVTVVDGTLAEGDGVESRVEADRRNDTRRNHSATHLLHRALREVLGAHVHQAGSFVSPDRLRFDFTHFQAMSADEIRRVEDIVNRAIFDSYPVSTKVMSYDDAIADGAMGLFEDKYQDDVRVVSMGDFSKELCGGTHVDNTAQVQLFHILSEQGVSSGVRRMEAVTGRGAIRQAQMLQTEWEEDAALLKVAPDQLSKRLVALLEENRLLKRDVQSFESQMAEVESRAMAEKVQTVEDARIVANRLDGKTMDELKEIADALQRREEKAVVALASYAEGRVYWVVSVAKELVEKGVKAGDLVKNLAMQTGGNGGGRPNFATAGGKDATKIDTAIASIPGLIEAVLK